MGNITCGGPHQLACEAGQLINIRPEAGLPDRRLRVRPPVPVRPAAVAAGHPCLAEAEAAHVWEVGWVRRRSA